MEIANTDLPDYDALSYTWGPAIEGEEDEVLDPPWRVLICETQSRAGESRLKQYMQVYSVNISNNLADYLKAYIQPAEQKGEVPARVTWIDALCIDQSNSEEKKVQIALMGEIYTKARLVVVWLGESKQCWKEFKWICSVAMREIHHFHKQHPQDICDQFSPISRELWSTYFPTLNPPTGDWPQVWGAFWRFLVWRRWFKRAWTYQEVVLPKTVLLVCGSDYQTLSLEVVIRTTIVLGFTGWLQDLALQFSGKGGYEWMQNVQISLMRHAIRGDKEINPSSYEGQLRRLSKEEWVILWSRACRDLCMRLCCYDEDRINATIGLANVMRPEDVPPSVLSEVVTLNEEEGYRWASSFFIRQLPDLRILSDVNPPSLKRMKCLPSWCVDFATPPLYDTLTDHPRSFDASGRRTKQVAGERSIDGDELRLDGIKICSLHVKLTLGPEALHEWCMLIIGTMHRYRNTSESGADAIWRTLVLDTNEKGEQPESSWGRDFTRWIEARYALNYLLPNFRDKAGNSSFDQWWESCLQNIAITAERGRFHGQAPQPDIASIRSMIDQVEHHPFWNDNKVAAADFYNTSEELWANLTTIGDAIPEFRKICQHAVWGRFPRKIDKGKSRRVRFWTSDGYLGVGYLEPPLPKPDEIWILNGATVPYILRPHEREKDTYTLVAECYLHGVMYGEHLACQDGPAMEDVVGASPRDASASEDILPNDPMPDELEQRALSENLIKMCIDSEGEGSRSRGGEKEQLEQGRPMSWKRIVIK